VATPPTWPRYGAKGAAGSLPDDVAERLFALAFALEQLGRDLDGLAHCVNEFAQSPPALPGR
jgi:hypothetical protein